MTLGKRVFDDLYVLRSALGQLEHSEHQRHVGELIGRLPPDCRDAVNVAKINLKSGGTSLLEYQDFNDVPFPELLRSWRFNPNGFPEPTYRTYSTSLNPPILHRKELLVPLSHPNRDQWVQLTATAEQLGLFDESSTIGFRLNWARFIASKGYRLVGSEFQPLGNELEFSPQDLGEPRDSQIQRHLTALTRNNVSAPVQLLLRHGLLSKNTSFFDYGCGRGGDVAYLSTSGIDSQGWDPYFAADKKIIQADVVNLGFVANVIEDPAERVDAIHKAFCLARQVMSVGVMLYGSDTPGRRYGDGFVTSRNTFQKYFSQGELKDYVEQVLNQEAFMVAPGVAFVFADKNIEQQFNAGRYRGKNIAARLLSARVTRIHTPRLMRERVERPPRLSRAEIQFSQAKDLLDAVWVKALDLGRLPERDELANADHLESEIGSLSRAFRLLSVHYDQRLLAAARQTRADDVRLYLAAQQFAKRPAYRKLEARLQRDVKAFFGDYGTAQAAGVRLLLDAADPDNLLSAAQLAATEGLGWLEESHSFQLHILQLQRLPAVLRAYVTCGLILWDAISEVQLVKIHISSGKLTLMEFEDFDRDPLPLLSRRIKVNVRKQDYDVFEYGSSQHHKPILYRKSRYLHEDHPGYAEQLAFDESVEALGILESTDYGPPPEQLNQLLEMRRLSVDGMKLVRSTRIPGLDEPCGANFTYRSFIECGETQKQLGIKNLPLNPASYNALYDLATKILDPLIEYFGSIRLTYGFCSAELGRHVTKRVAHKLDQHAACETGRLGKLICHRGGAACDLIVEDEDMREVAEWIIGNVPFDRLYYYGPTSPLHVSHSVNSSGAAFAMVAFSARQLIPRPLISTNSSGNLTP